MTFDLIKAVILGVVEGLTEGTEVIVHPGDAIREGVRVGSRT